MVQANDHLELDANQNWLSSLTLMWMMGLAITVGLAVWSVFHCIRVIGGYANMVEKYQNLLLELKDAEVALEKQLHTCEDGNEEVNEERWQIRCI